MWLTVQGDMPSPMLSMEAFGGYHKYFLLYEISKKKKIGTAIDMVCLESLGEFPVSPWNNMQHGPIRMLESST